MALTDRASLLRELANLIDADLNDDAATEYDSTAGEQLYLLLNRGAKNAQDFLIRAGYGEYWLTTSAALTWTGTDATTAGRYSDLPSNFRRAYGDRHESPLRQADGTQWGREIHPRDRLRYAGDFYYFTGNRIWVTRQAALPDPLYLDYLKKVDTLADSTDADFPEDDRELIPAFAAVEASRKSWFNGGLEEKQALMKHLRALKHEVYSRLRPSRQPRSPRHAPAIGTRYY